MTDRKPYEAQKLRPLTYGELTPEQRAWLDTSQRDATVQRLRSALKEACDELEGALAYKMEFLVAKDSDRETLARLRAVLDEVAPAVEDRYFILSCKWTRDSYLVWWRPQARGYTEWLDQAGVFTKDDAEGKCAGLQGSAVPVPCTRAFLIHQVVPNDSSDVGDLFEEWRRKDGCL